MKESFKSFCFLVVLIIIGSFIVFSHFYNIVIVKKQNFVFEKEKNPMQVQQDKTEELKTQIPIKNESLEVNLNNLSEAELKSVQNFLKFKKIKAQTIPLGVPEVYGKELNVSFDRVQDAINKVRVLGPTYGERYKKITLQGADLQRYIKIGSQTSCQYCCGARTLVFEDGRAACGCAHSIMMRGLAAYLIKNHPEMSDERILEELNKWKRAFFPKQTLSSALQSLKEKGEEGIEELLQEFPDFLPQMVGGC